jgi:hypothetical protein
MAQSVLNAPQFQTEEAAFAYVESKLWPTGPVCHHCGSVDRLARVPTQRTKPSKRHPEGKLTVGLWRCYACEGRFTVRVGTIFEDSHIGLHLWLQVIHLFCCSKKGIATRQIQRMLNCSMKTAWHLGHRIRMAMTPDGSIGPLGGAGKTVEADETELARSRKTKRPPNFRRSTHNPKVMSLVERGGNIRSVMLDHRGAGRHLRALVHKDSRLVTDQAQHYKLRGFAKHESVDHSKFEWTRGDVHTNTLEGFFSVLKRGLVGVYQNVDQKHLNKYLAEFDFRQNTRARLGVDDTQRASMVLEGTKGKRLYYRQPA